MLVPSETTSSSENSILNSARDLFASPEWYPLQMDFERRYLTFIRMSQKAYQESTFHAARAARRFGRNAFDMRLDDVMLAASTTPVVKKPIHFVLHCGLCCSTLLTRYLDLFPSSVVMKEPSWLTQLAVARHQGIPDWQEILDLSIRLLTRTYHPEQITTIKTNIPCNPLGRRFLENNRQARVTFIMIALRDFMLAILKNQYRRGRVQYWTRDLYQNPTDGSSALAGIQPDKLSDEQAAVCYWLQTRFICTQLSSFPDRSRVLILNGQRIADSPRQVLTAVARMCRQTLTEEQLTWLIGHPSVHQHSKNISRPYDTESRSQELEQLEGRYGREIDSAIEWVLSLGIDPALLNVPEGDVPRASD